MADVLTPAVAILASNTGISEAEAAKRTDRLR